VPSDGGLILIRELDERLGLENLIQEQLSDNWSLTSLQQGLVKTGGQLIKHALFHSLLLAEENLDRRMSSQVLRRKNLLSVPSGQHSPSGRIWGLALVKVREPKIAEAEHGPIRNPTRRPTQPFGQV